ncbi:UDP-N-acetylglucosamine 2-epimerase (non-hydrolysing) [Caminicella sporogenes DSM 14501]|uniref:UDP-N-acetylglucosamine 2-epimerase (non-hydrolyzing) n=2 Tax=Caminicella TaxID=166484 RepID=A0A1M6PT83_9FIRM|nr:UDP-N-acetylglucosamine 2-epimerase (non-hydrolyzing) [Caminicella sporogenes]RKD21984.1 UDP-N-acetylglucosamine 2-epimerase [Caminicella sporogenes]SHK11214.1 UDP-N-acetylglucosamine 2-epimerase (non-hydrolysing) [Caminicella sporogenes DSM 14501]
MINNSKLKIMSIFGTRPEAIKMAPVVKKLEETDGIESIVCVTAQHREMLDQVLNLFDIRPQYDLNIMKPGQTLSEITCRALKGLEKVIREVQPHMVLVHGDTTTTFVGALAAFYNKTKVGHVEAGLRSGNMYSPYPEEVNRSLTGRLSHLHFAPTEGNKNNLLREGVREENIIITGNTVIDALLSVVDDNYKFDIDILNEIDYKNKKVILLTSHRRENLGKPMENIFCAVKDVVEKNKNVEVIFPVHLNPKVREIAYSILDGLNRVHLIEPLDYEPFANLMNKCDIVLTDSGGIQEEAPSLGKPVLVLRTETERPEAVKAGTVKIAGVERENIFKLTDELINNKDEYDKMANAINPYGDGKASERIVKAIREYFGERN